VKEVMKMKSNSSDKNNTTVKWKEILILWIIVIACFWMLWSCARNKDKKCKVFDGTGYYHRN